MKRAAALTSLLSAVVLVITAPSPGLANTTSVTPDHDIQAHFDRGDEFFSQGNLNAARREYQAAAQMTRKSGQLPAKALHRIAYTQHYEGRYQSAGKTLEKLAKEAAAFGDLKTEAWALADAAWVAGKAGDTIDVQRRVARLERLLTSPYLPADVKTEIRTKRLGDYSLALAN